LQSQRKDAFVAIGRFFGLCLWFRYTIPFMVCRHVAKMLLGRCVQAMAGKRARGREGGIRFVGRRVGFRREG
jgi:hypothetical protein